MSPAAIQPSFEADHVPPLEPGDRLSRAEFEKRYNAMLQGIKAELIEGVVHMPSPVRFRRHGHPHAHLIGWLVQYEAETPGVATSDNSTPRLDLDNEPQPDAVLLIDPAYGGQAHISQDDYVETAPELVAEITSSTASFDVHAKFHVYRRNGVREYIVWRVLDRTIDWFVLRAGQYERLEPDAQGILRSETFPGLWLHPAALLDGNMAAVLSLARQGSASSEHQSFVQQLQAAADSLKES